MARQSIDIAPIIADCFVDGLRRHAAATERNDKVEPEEEKKQKQWMTGL